MRHIRHFTRLTICDIQIWVSEAVPSKWPEVGRGAVQHQLKNKQLSININKETEFNGLSEFL